jgi:hypothetical protein
MKTKESEVIQAARDYCNSGDKPETSWPLFIKLKQAISALDQSDPNNLDDKCFHECPDCNSRCNCSNQPCSCCNQSEPSKREGKTAIEILSDVTGLSVPYMTKNEKDVWTITPQKAVEAIELYSDQQTAHLLAEIESLKAQNNSVLSDKIKAIKEEFSDRRIRELNPIWVRDEILKKLEK